MQKTLAKHVTYDCKCKFENTACNSNQNGIMKSANVSAKSYGMHKNNFNWNPSICICENGRYLKHIADTLVIVNNEFMNAVIVYQEMRQMLYQQISQLLFQ